MKKVFLFIILFIASAASFAQSNNKDEIYLWKNKTYGNKLLSVSYNPMNLINTNEDLHAISMELTGLHALSYVNPFYFDTGLGASITFGKKYTNGQGSLDDKPKLFFFSLKLPLNIGYKIDLDELNFIFPYLGIYLRGNIAGSYMSEKSTLDAFDKGKVGDNNAFQYLQVGYSFGVKLVTGKLFLGVAYEKDINELQKDNKAASNKISIGYRF